MSNDYYSDAMEWLGGKYIEAYLDSGEEPDYEHIDAILAGIADEGYDRSPEGRWADALVELGLRDADDERDVWY